MACVEEYRNFWTTSITVSISSSLNWHACYKSARFGTCTWNLNLSSCSFQGTQDVSQSLGLGQTDRKTRVFHGRAPWPRILPQSHCAVHNLCSCFRCMFAVRHFIHNLIFFPKYPVSKKYIGKFCTILTLHTTVPGSSRNTWQKLWNKEYI